jgi:hypothetical protein
MLFEMTAGYELCTFEPTAGNLSDIHKYPQVRLNTIDSLFYFSYQYLFYNFSYICNFPWPHFIIYC